VCKCTKCGEKQAVSTSTVGIVKVQSLYCPTCDTYVFTSSFIRPFSRPDMAFELERLRSRHLYPAAPYVKAAIDYLQDQVDLTFNLVAAACAANKKKKLDLWERQFIKDATS
jgi:hypothetical protein